MGQLGKRRIVGLFVSAEMVLVADGARLHGRKPASAKHSGPMMFRIHHQFHLHGYDLLDVIQQFAAHVFRKIRQCSALLRACLVVNQQHGLCWIGFSYGSPSVPFARTAAATVSPSSGTPSQLPLCTCQARIASFPTKLTSPLAKHWPG